MNEGWYRTKSGLPVYVTPTRSGVCQVQVPEEYQDHPLANQPDGRAPSDVTKYKYYVREHGVYCGHYEPQLDLAHKSADPKEVEYLLKMWREHGEEQQ